MPRFCLILIVIAALLLGVASPAFASGPEDPFSGANQQLLRGDALYYEGDYYRALTAYKEFLWAKPGDRRANRVRLKKAWIYRISGDHRESARILDGLTENSDEDVEAWWAQFYLGQVAVDAERTPLASRAFEGILDLCEPQLVRLSEGAQDPEAVSCMELTGRSRLALADVYASRHEFDTAIGHLRQVPADSPWATEAAEIADVVDGISIPRKSPALAGTLSIVPGLGHFYLGEYSNGILAMAWNGIFIYGLVDSILSGRYGQAALIGLLESIWYGGTIFGAIAGAQRFNRDAQRVVESGMRRDIASMTDETPWPARFPVRAPGYLELNIQF